jgi:hypothetical protein
VASDELPGALLKAGMAYTSRMAGLSLRLVGALMPDVARVVEIGAGRDASPASERDGDGQVRIDAAAGSTGYGVFMVENRGAEPVTSDVGVSSFRAGTGRAVRPAVRFEPNALTLAPGEQAIVQVAVAIPERLAAGRTYTATIDLPGLEGARIPIAITRRP